MRICSLLPSATEIVYALGLGEQLAGVTHECDFPPEARAKPVLIRPRTQPAASAAEIDRQVKEIVARGESLYVVDDEVLRSLAPDLILTQDLCHVCAASPQDLAAALSRMDCPPQVLTLSPRSLAEVWGDIRSVGKAAGREEQAAALVRSLEDRLAAVQRAVAGLARPRVLCLEWLDPPYVAGHWVPEMVAAAGGVDAIGRCGVPSFQIDWEQALAAQPDVVLVMPCGYALDAVLQEYRNMKMPPGWSELPAVRSGRVFAADSSSYFSRPGPRLACGVEILAEILHPSRVHCSLPTDSFRAIAPR
jgi:iron complex transport system substrate-binding protein